MQGSRLFASNVLPDLPGDHPAERRDADENQQQGNGERERVSLPKGARKYSVISRTSAAVLRPQPLLDLMVSHDARPERDPRRWLDDG